MKGFILFAILAIIAFFILDRDVERTNPLAQAQCATAAENAHRLFVQTNSGDNLPMIDGTKENKKDATATINYRYNFKEDLGLCFVEYIISMKAKTIDTGQQISGKSKLVTALVADISSQQSLAIYFETSYPTGSKVLSNCSIQKPGHYSDLSQMPVKDLFEPTKCTSEAQFDSIVEDRFGIKIDSPLITQKQPSINNPKTLSTGGNKCVVEDGDLRICDLSYSASVEGNSAFCVDLITEVVSEASPDWLWMKVNENPTFCVTDLGNVYIDPRVEVSKFYGAITRDGYSSPYKINNNYYTCIWTYNDGNGNIPYLQVLGKTGPTSGYNVKAFCKNGLKLDIYSYND